MKLCPGLRLTTWRQRHPQPTRCGVVRFSARAEHGACHWYVQLWWRNRHLCLARTHPAQGGRA